MAAYVPAKGDFITLTFEQRQPANFNTTSYQRVTKLYGKLPNPLVERTSPTPACAKRKVVSGVCR